MKLSRFTFSLFIIFYSYSCLSFNKPDLYIEPYEFSGLKVVFADLEDSYKRSKNFNKIWSKVHKNRYRPYFRFSGKSYTIVGILNKYKQSFLIIKDENGKQYKMKLNQEEIHQKILPKELFLRVIIWKSINLVDFYWSLTQ